MSDQPKRRGRPLKDASDRRSSDLKFRVRSEMRDRIGREAEAAGLSISAYVEAVLERRFLASELRKIVREEIAAALSAPVVHTVTDVSATRVRPNIVARIPRYDHLPS